jgi:hypothetical protein
MNKKRDDFQLPRGGAWPERWRPVRIPRQRAFRRAVGTIGVITLVYLLYMALPFKFLLGRGSDTIPQDYLPSHGRASFKYRGATPAYNELPDFSPYGSRKKPKSQSATRNRDKVRDRSYNGPIIFPELAPSLRAVTYDTQGQLQDNKNVLFAAGSLDSAAVLLPMACQMGRELRNYVHFALMSRSEIDLDDLKKINGIDDSCHVIFHGPC